MESNTISVISSSAASVATIFPILALAYIWFRTRSSHLLGNRLWQIVNGLEGVDDPEVKQAVADRTSLMRFRFTFGIQADSLAHAQRILRWARKNEVDMTQVADCGCYFDLNAIDLRPKQPSSKTKKMAEGLLLAPFILATAAILAMGTPQALARLNETGDWFWLTKDSARRLTLADVAAVRPGDCSGTEIGPPVPTGFSPRDTEIVCEIFAADDKQPGKDVATFVHDAVFIQRVLAGVFFILAVAFGFNAFGFRKKVRAAIKLRKSLDDQSQFAVEGKLATQD